MSKSATARNLPDELEDLEFIPEKQEPPPPAPVVPEVLNRELQAQARAIKQVIQQMEQLDHLARQQWEMLATLTENMDPLPRQVSGMSGRLEEKITWSLAQQQRVSGQALAALARAEKQIQDLYRRRPPWWRTLAMVIGAGMMGGATAAILIMVLA